MKKFSIYPYGLALLCVYFSVLGCATYEANNELSSIDSAAATPTVEFNNLILRRPQAITLDVANNRALVVDSGLGAVVAVDLLTGTHTMLSDAATPNTANPFRTPISIALDAANNQALVLDRRLKAVVVVDLKTGARTILSDATTPNAFYAFRAPEGVVLDAANNRALVLDSSMDAVVAVDLTTGVRSILSYVTDLISHMGDIALDVANGRVLVAGTGLNFAGVVEAVDLKSGVRAILSNATTPNTANSLRFLISITIDAANNRVLVLDWSLKAVVAVDLTTGARTILSHMGASLRGMVLDADRGRVLALDSKLGVVVLDLKTGVRTILSNTAPSNAANPFRAPTSIALDAANDRALVVDYGLDAVVAVDLTTGARTILSNLSNATTPNVTQLHFPQSITLDAVNGRALVLTRVGGGDVMAVDLKTGVHTTLSGGTTLDAMSSIIGFPTPHSITLDAVNGRALVVDSFLGAVVEVDLETGARTILSNATTPDAVNRISYPRSITLDAVNDRALVVDFVLDAVVAVDLATGARTILSDATTPNAANSFSQPESIALDAANGRALVVDSVLGAVVAVDLTTGARTILSDATTPNTTNLFGKPVSIALDAANNRALVLDWGLKAVVAVDLKIGARTIFSM